MAADAADRPAAAVACALISELLGPQKYTMSAQKQLLLSTEQACRASVKTRKRAAPAERMADAADEGEADMRAFLKTPLGAAIRDGDTVTLRRLIADGAAINEPIASTFPLEVAAGQGKLECVRLLIEARAEVDQQTELPTSLGASGHNHRTTALMPACSNGHLACVRLLVRSGASVNLVCGAFCPLVCCCVNESLACARFLIESGAEVDIVCSYSTPLCLHRRRHRQDGPATPRFTRRPREGRARHPAAAGSQLRPNQMPEADAREGR